MRNPLRLAAVAAAGLLVATIAGPASAAPDDRGAAWLSSQLTDGLVHNDYYDFDDYGLTADTGYALAEIGGQGDALVALRDALAGKVDSWTTGVDFGSDDVYAGSVAKAVVLAQVAGGDPRDFGSVDLVARLEDRISDVAPVGRLEDAAETDYANTIGQAFAARGLAVAGSEEADESIGFLLKQQCSQGYFRLGLAAKDAAKQGCDAGTAEESAPDTDVTALAVINLRAIPKAQRTAEVRAAVGDAVGWLKRQQKDNGSFGGGTATEGSNANSTGLAAWALGETGACARAQDAARWVKGLQVAGDVSGTPLADEKGAIAYNRIALMAARGDGIGTPEQDQWRRATAQAAPGLQFLACG